MTKQLPILVNFNQVDKNDIGLVGGKGANLGEMIKAGFPVPPGFIVTSAAYYHVLKVNNLKPKIKEILDQFIKFRKVTIKRKSLFNINRIQLRLEILEGFLIVYKFLDTIIKIIRTRKFWISIIWNNINFII